MLSVWHWKWRLRHRTWPERTPLTRLANSSVTFSSSRHPKVSGSRAVVTSPFSVRNKWTHFHLWAVIQQTFENIRLGSLSALIYQHSVTPLALPIKLVLPENDLVLKDGVSLAGQSPASPTTQLLTQGAACSLLYLFTMDTESLTGPQAIQRTMTHLLDAKPLPMPTVVHFKVSSQGITLTDNERKLFFR